MARGGYRSPDHPAPVSGPGALSQRTDSQPKRSIPDAEYGEQRDYEGAEGEGAMAGASVTPFSQLTSTRPDEPVTAGAAAGPGAGPEQAGIQMDMAKADAAQMAPMLKSLEIIANLPNSNPSTRNFVRQLRANLGR